MLALALLASPMSSLPSPSSSSSSSAATAFLALAAPAMEPVVRSILTSTWHAVDQPPPPSLREILAAYKAKGDGDREMLLTMLNAKSAEDQRIASMASLHRTMLEMYNTPLPPPQSRAHEPHPAHSHLYQPHFPTPPPTTSYHNSPPLPPHPFSLQAESSMRLHKQDPVPESRSRIRERERDREPPVATSSSRKRRRSSRSPPPASSRDHRARTAASGSRPTPPHDLPPSPYSSSSTHGSSHDSPRSRESMAIGSLLSEPDSGLHLNTTGRRTSSERSTTSLSPEPGRR